jgi:hypothetical protein
MGNSPFWRPHAIEPVALSEVLKLLEYNIFLNLACTDAMLASLP